MWEILVEIGMKSLTTAEEVEEVINQKDKTVLCFVNSVCGCAAGSARPGVALALQNALIPDELVTVFAGMDQEAVARTREFMGGIAPSSPNVVVFKNGEPVYVMERRHIERMAPQEIAGHLTTFFDENCTNQGPSVSREVYNNLLEVDVCGCSLSTNT
jgi:putative YphP/YqiW family bacilliredoxin